MGGGGWFPGPVWRRHVEPSGIAQNSRCFLCRKTIFEHKLEHIVYAGGEAGVAVAGAGGGLGARATAAELS